MNRFDIITIGSATRDVFLKSQAIKIVRDDQFSTGEAECFALGSKIDIDQIVFETGGGATNTAVGFARQGFRTAFIGRVGAHDARGRLVLSELRSERVSTNLVIHDQRHMTGYSAILLTPRGERTVLVFRGASSGFRPNDVIRKSFQANWLYVTSLGGNLSVIRAIWKYALRKNIKIAWNPGGSELAAGFDKLLPFFKQADIVSLNQEEATGLFGLNRFQHQPAFRKIRDAAGGITVITLGTDGSLAGTRTDAWHCGTHPIPVTDTTGAGDAFGCGFVGEYVRSHGKIGQALQFATANSESVIQHIGAKHGLLKRHAKRGYAIVTKIE